MVNTNCSFLKFNDLMGIHRVVFDSLIDGKSFAESVADVKAEYLQKYYGHDLRGIGNDPDTVKEMLSDVASAINLAAQVIEDANGMDGVQTKIDIDEAQTIINNIVGGWQAQILSDSGVLATRNVETRNAEEEREATATTGDITPFRKEDILFNSNIVAEPLNTSVLTIKGPLDLISNYFKAATMAKSKLTRGFYNDLFKASFIDLTNPNATPVVTSKEVDTNIKAYKDTLFKTLFPGEDLYVDGITRDDLQERLSVAQMQLQQMNGGNGVYVQDLLRWAFLDSPELKKYNAFISLKHFDDLVRMYGGGFVSVKSNLVGNYAETLEDIKYLPANMSNMRTAWSNNEIISIAQETTAIFKTFVETTPIINLEGNRTNNFLKPDQVYYSLSKLKNSIDKSDVSTSVKTAIQDALEAHFNGTNKSLNNTDVKSLLTLYQRVYMDKDQNAKWMKNSNLASVIRNIESIGENSLYSVYKTHFPGRNNLNLLEVISSAINKVDLMNYNEVSYDFPTKEFKSISLQTKLNDRQFNGLKTLGSQSLNATVQSVETLSRDLNFNVDQEKVEFNFSNSPITYNVLEGTFTDQKGDPYNFNNVNVPTNITDLAIEEYAVDFPQYKSILETVSALTGQPLTALNYEIPQIMNDNFGKSHVQDLLVIAGNAAYTSYLKANHLQDLNNMSTADIETALNGVMGLTSAFPFKTLWNSRMGYFNIDFGNLAYQALRNYADVLNEVYGSNIKSTTVNAEGNSVPTYTLSRMINDFNGIVGLMRNSEHNYNMPLADNMFITNTNNDLLKKVEIRLNLKDMKGNVVSSAALSDVETVYYDIFNDYLEQKLQDVETDRNPKFQATNYADKSSHAAIVINGNAEIEINGARKKYRNFKSDDYRDYFFQTQKSYFDNTWNTLRNDYVQLFESGALPKRYLASSSILKDAMGGIEPIGTINIDALEDRFKGDKLSKEVKAYNKLASVSESYLQGKDGSQLSIADVNDIIGNVNEKVLTAALSDAGINTIKVLSYEIDAATKKPVINRTLQYMMDSFGSNSESFQNNLKRNFLQSLDDVGFTLDYLNPGTLAENSLLSRASEQWDLAKFKDSSLGRFKLYTGSLKGDFEMNPLLEQYLWEYNLNTQNFQNATVGTVLGHPSKIKRSATDTDHSYNTKMISARSIAMFKRMVIHQATFHPYNLNLVNGVNFYNRVSFIKDPGADVFSPYGTRGEVDITDGSTYNSPLLTILQNNSLLDQRAGWTQKSIGGGINSKYNSAELLKHAAHSITNERLNNENTDARFSWLGLIEKGHNMPFNVNGIPVKVDITTDYNGQPINLENIFDDVAFFDPILNQYQSVNKIEKSPNWLSNNEYNIYYKDLTTGQVLDPQAIKIDTLFDLWQALGGKNSISYQEGEYDHRLARPENLKSYIPSNRSWEALAEFVNRVGVWNNETAAQTLSNGEYSGRDIREAYSQTVMNPLNTDNNYDANTSSPSQKTLIQPLKQSFIGQYTFSSGQKVGVQNENDSNVLNTGNITQLKFALVSNMHTGVQLNSDHETDDSIVTEPTQITNTLPFNGDTPEYARRAYKAVFLYIDNSLSRILPDIDKTLDNPDAKFRVYNVIANEIVRGLDGTDTVGMAGAIAVAVQSELNRYKEELKQIIELDPSDIKHQQSLTRLEELDKDGFKLPFSDSNVYSSFSTTAANYFTKNGIRRKLPGMAAVISPYSGFAGVRQIIDPQTNKVSVVNETAYKAWKENLIAAGENPATYETTPVSDFNKDLIEMYDTVIDPNGKQFNIDTPDKYYAVKSSTGEFTKLNTASRDLKPTTHKWKIEGNEGYTNYYDLHVSKLSFLNETVQNAFNDLMSVTGNTEGKLNDEGKSQYELETEGTAVSNFDSKSKKLAGLLSEYNDLIAYSSLETDIPQYNIKAERYGDDFTIDISKNGEPQKASNKFDLSFNDRTKRLMKNELTQILQVVNQQKRAPMPISSLNVPGVLGRFQILTDFNDKTKTISAQEHYLNYIKEFPGTSIQQWYKDVKPMVRVDDLTTVPGEIMMPPVFKTKYGITANTNVSDIDQKFFQSKLDYNALPHTNTHDFYVRSLNGEHLYAILEGSENYKKLDLREVKVDTLSVKRDDGSIKTYKVDDNGDAQYELGYNHLYQSMIDGKMHNFVVVKNLDDLKNLQAITKGPNSSYKDIVPNFQAGLNVATLGIEFLNDSKNKDAKRFAKSLKAINGIINKTRGIKSAQASSEKLASANQAALMSIYDGEWASNEIESLTRALSPENAHKSDAIDKQRMTDKLQHVTNYLNTINSGDENAIISQASRMREGELRRANNRIQKLTESLMKSDTAVDQALREMANYMQVSLTNRNERFSRDMYSSFITQLNVTAARIPGQHMQSYMGQTVVGFIHSEENLAFVSPSHMWITGEDFDIDKAYISQYSVDDNGKLIGWSDMFNYETPETLTKSLQLPIPDQTAKTFVIDAGTGLSLTPTDASSILGYLNNKIGFNNYVDAMAKLDDAKIVNLGLIPVEQQQELKDHINGYFLSEMNQRYPKEASLNVLVSAVNGASNDIRNINAVFSPMTFGDAGEAAAKSKKGQGFNSVSPFNPVDIARAKNNNMIGRDVIGISASTGLKGYSALSNAFIQIMTDPDFDIPVYREVYDYTQDENGNAIKDNKRVSVGIAGINYTNSIDQFMQYYQKTLEKEQIPVTPEELQKVRDNTIETLRYRGDVALDLSAVLSAATDNAKELILARINAGPETVTFYLSGLMQGYSFESMANLMTSNEAEAMVTLASRNVFTGKRVTLDQSIKQLAQGVLRPRDYFDYNTARVVVDQLRKSTDLVNKIKDTFSKETSDAQKEMALKNPFYFLESAMQVLNREDLLKLNIKNSSVIEGDYTTENYKFNKPASNEEGNLDDEIRQSTEQPEMIEDNQDGQHADTPQDQEDYGDNEYDSYNEQSNRNAKKQIEINAEVAFNRYKEAVVKYIPSGLNGEILRDLSDFADTNKDFEVLGKILSINQAIKVTDYDMYKYFNNITDYMTGKYGIVLRSVEDFNRFVSDPNFREDVFNSNPGANLDVLKVLYKSDHFSKMFELAVKTDMMKNNLSMKNRSVRDIVKNSSEMVGLNTINRKQFTNISRFVDEAIIANFLSSTDTTHQLIKGDYDETDQPIFADKNITLDTVEGRSAFVNWFEKTVMNDLKAGRLRDNNNEYPSQPNINLRENMFIQQLQLDVRKDPFLKKNYNFYKLPINLNSNATEDEKVLIDTITGAFAALRNEQYGGKKVLDLLYLYNLIVNKNRSNNQSFNSLFDSVSENFDNDSVMTKFVKFESEMDWNGVTLTQGQHYHPGDTAFKGIVRVMDSTPKVKTDGENPQFLATDTWDDDRGEMVRTIHYLEGSDYVPLMAPEYSEKVLNINNGSSNLSGIVTDNNYKIKLNRLNKLLENMEIEQLNCN